MSAFGGFGVYCGCTSLLPRYTGQIACVLYIHTLFLQYRGLIYYLDEACILHCIAPSMFEPPARQNKHGCVRVFFSIKTGSACCCCWLRDSHAAYHSTINQVIGILATLPIEYVL